MADARRQINDAKGRLRDARSQLDDAKATIAENLQKLRDGEIEYEDARPKPTGSWPMPARKSRTEKPP